MTYVYCIEQLTSTIHLHYSHKALSPFLMFSEGERAQEFEIFTWLPALTVQWVVFYVIDNSKNSLSVQLCVAQQCHTCCLSMPALLSRCHCQHLLSNWLAICQLATVLQTKKRSRPVCLCKINFQHSSQLYRTHVRHKLYTKSSGLFGQHNSQPHAYTDVLCNPTDM